MERTIKVGILGCGRFAKRRIIPALTKIPALKLHSIHNRSEEKAELLAKEYNCALYTDKEEKLINDPDLNALIITSPTHLHKDHLLLASKRGLAVFIEKPICRTYEETRGLESLNIPIVVGHCYRFKSALKAAKSFLSSGKLGELLSIEACFEMNIPKKGWRFDKTLGSGVTLDLGVHLIDSIRFLTDSEFSKVYARGSLHGDVDHSIDVLASLTNNTKVSFSASFASPYRSTLTLTGTEGRLYGDYIFRADDDDKESLIFEDLENRISPAQLHPQNIIQAELEHFFEVIEGRPNLLTLESAIENIRVIDAINKSLKSKREEPVDREIINHLSESASSL